MRIAESRKNLNERGFALCRYQWALHFRCVARNVNMSQFFGVQIKNPYTISGDTWSASDGIPRSSRAGERGGIHRRTARRRVSPSRRGRGSYPAVRADRNAQHGECNRRTHTRTTGSHLKSGFKTRLRDHCPRTRTRPRRPATWRCRSPMFGRNPPRPWCRGARRGLPRFSA